MSNHSQQALIDLLSGIRNALQERLAACSGSDGERRAVLLGLEQLWKIEEQVVMPALQEAAPALAADVAHATREIEVMRDLASRIEHSAGAALDLALGALEGVVRLHGAASDTLLVRVDGASVNWRVLHEEVLDLLARWRTEIRVDGEIEDEERDPVGLPPR